MADINNFRQLDFQELGEPADNDRVLIVEIDNDKVVGAKNYALAKLKGYISADALAYLEECRLINASVSEKEERVSNIASQSADLLESTRGETIESLEQTVTSTEPGGVNVFTITQKNGSQKSLQTRNGLRGPEGPQGPQGPAVPLVQTTGQSTTEAMSQKAVSDELSQLKSDKVDKRNVMKTYEEIMASTNLDDISSANSLKDTINSRFNKFMCFPQYSTSDFGHIDGQVYFEDFSKELIKELFKKIEYREVPLIGSATCAGKKAIFGYMYNSTNDNVTPNYAWLIALDYKKIILFGYYNGSHYYKEL